MILERHLFSRIIKGYLPDSKKHSEPAKFNLNIKGKASKTTLTLTIHGCSYHPDPNNASQIAGNM